MTPGAKRVLEELAADEDRDLLEERGAVYCGDRRTTIRVVNELLRLAAISVTGEFRDQSRYYGISDVGRSLLRRPELEPEIQRAFASAKSFSIVNDQVVPI